MKKSVSNFLGHIAQLYIRYFWVYDVLLNAPWSPSRRCAVKRAIFVADCSHFQPLCNAPRMSVMSNIIWCVPFLPLWRLVLPPCKVSRKSITLYCEDLHCSLLDGSWTVYQTCFRKGAHLEHYNPQSLWAQRCVSHEKPTRSFDWCLLCSGDGHHTAGANATTTSGEGFYQGEGLEEDGVVEQQQA